MRFSLLLCAVLAFGVVLVAAHSHDDHEPSKVLHDAQDTQNAAVEGECDELAEGETGGFLEMLSKLIPEGCESIFSSTCPGFVVISDSLLSFCLLYAFFASIFTTGIDFACMKDFALALLPKLMGYGIIAGAIFLKVPQIVNIVSAKSAKGVQKFTYLLEIFGYIVTLCFYFRRDVPFSAFGEYLFIVIQNLIVVFLMDFYGRTMWQFFAADAGAVALFFVFWACPLQIVDWLMSFNIALFAIARLPQVWFNYRNQTTGSLSSLTLFMQVGGSASRIFTTLREVKDDPDAALIAVLGYVVGGGVNLIILLQIVWYKYLGFGKKGDEDEGEDKDEKEDKKEGGGPPREEGGETGAAEVVGEEEGAGEKDGRA